MIMRQSEAFEVNTSLTVSGGATPSVTGEWIDTSRATGSFSLILENSGASTDLTVTYELGYIKKSDEKTGTITSITPADGGTITNFTNLDIHSNSQHESLSGLAPAQFYRFKCTNNDAANTAAVSLYVLYQVD